MDRLRALDTVDEQPSLKWRTENLLSNLPTALTSDYKLQSTKRTSTGAAQSYVQIIHQFGESISNSVAGVHRILKITLVYQEIFAFHDRQTPGQA